MIRLVGTHRADHTENRRQLKRYTYCGRIRTVHEVFCKKYNDIGDGKLRWKKIEVLSYYDTLIYIYTYYEHN